MSKKYTPLWRETRLQVKIYKTHQATQNILPKLEARIIEFLSEWLVTFLMPAKHLLDTRAPHLYFMFLKEYWFKELYLGLKVTASFDFFRPMPSWLSPGRYSRSIAAKRWIVNYHAMPSKRQ